MKLKSILIASTMLAFVTANTALYAAEANGEKAEGTKAEKTEAKKPVKKHSHQQEKGITPAESKAVDSGHESMKDMHDHTKDRH